MRWDGIKCSRFIVGVFFVNDDSGGVFFCFCSEEFKCSLYGGVFGEL